MIDKAADHKYLIANSQSIFMICLKFLLSNEPGYV